MLFAVAQWFPSRDGSAPGGHLAKSVDIFGCLACRAGEAMEAVKHPTLQKITPAPNLNCLAQKINAQRFVETDTI